ncbi:hypothetical protein Peur_061250 [Populus x canadensis]
MMVVASDEMGARVGLFWTSVNGRHGKGGWHLELGAPSSMKRDNEERQKRCFQHCQATEAIGFYLVMCVLTGASYYTVSTCIKVQSVIA